MSKKEDRKFVPSDTPRSLDKAVLEGFNEKVSKLESGGFFKRFVTETPEIFFHFDKIDRCSVGELDLGEDGQPAVPVEMSGHVRVWVKDFDQDAIDAFVLTYRMLTQKNDRYGLKNVADIYSNLWMDSDLKMVFDEARNKVHQDDELLTTIDFGRGRVRRGHLMDVVIYGGLAHSNPVKEAEFRSWTSNPTVGASMWIEFITHMRSHMHAFLRIRDINAVTLHCYFGCEAPSHLQ